MYQRKDGRWVEAFTEHGLRKYIYAPTKKELIKKIREYNELTQHGKKFSDVLDDWKEEHYPTLVYSTRKGYEPSVKRAKECFGDRWVKDISAAEVQAFIKSLGAKGFGKKTVLTQLTVLRMAFDYAICHGMIQFNPCQSVKIPRGLPQKKRDIPSQHDIDVVNQCDWLLPFFLLYTGCRRGEALAITYEDIDWEKKTISITKAVGFKNNCPYIKPTKTDAGTRLIPLLKILEEKIPKDQSGLIFHKNGEMYHETNFLREWEAWQRKHKVSVTAHQLRHMYATILHDADIEVKDAQKFLGHSTVAMTQDVYTHIRESRQHLLAEKIDSFVSSSN